MSDANRVSVRAAIESVYGTAPAGGAAWKELPITGESLQQNTQTATSQTLRSDRQIVDLVRTGISAGGDLTSELIFGGFDDLIQAALLASAWSAEHVNTGTFSTDSGTSKVTGTGVDTGVNVGELVYLRNFPGEVDGVYLVTAKATGELTLSPAPPTSSGGGDEEVGHGYTATNGTTLVSLAIERAYLDLSNEFALYTGMAPQGWGLSVNPQNIVTQDFSLLGAKEESKASSGAGAFTAAPTTKPMNAVEHAQRVFVNDVVTEMTNFTSRLNNNLRERLIVGKLGAASLGTGTVDLSGSFEGFYESSTIMDQYLNFTDSSLKLGFKDAAGNGFAIEIPKLKWSNGRRVAGGINQDIVGAMDFTALRYLSGSLDYTLKVHRWPAA